MLIESTRDSLCFTVTHYKHSKQQYSIQVRSGRRRGLGERNFQAHVRGVAPCALAAPTPSCLHL